jgi:hypothetical protein
MKFDPDCRPFAAAAGRFHVELILAGTELTGGYLELGDRPGERWRGHVPVTARRYQSNELGMACVESVYTRLKVFDFAGNAEPLGKKLVVAQDLVAEPVVAGEQARGFVEVERLAFARKTGEEAARDCVLEL